MRELDERAMELAKAEEDCRRAINTATKDYNKALVSVNNYYLLVLITISFVSHFLISCSQQTTPYLSVNNVTLLNFYITANCTGIEVMPEQCSEEAI